jgi:hypothetical protein
MATDQKIGSESFEIAEAAEDNQGPRVDFPLSLSPEMNRRIEELSERTKLPKEDVLNLAVGLLKAASDVIAEGKRVGIVDGDQELDEEFTGL